MVINSEISIDETEWAEVFKHGFTQMDMSVVQIFAKLRDQKVLFFRKLSIRDQSIHMFDFWFQTEN